MPRRDKPRVASLVCARAIDDRAAQSVELVAEVRGRRGDRRKHRAWADLDPRHAARFGKERRPRSAVGEVPVRNRRNHRKISAKRELDAAAGACSDRRLALDRQRAHPHGGVLEDPLVRGPQRPHPRVGGNPGPHRARVGCGEQRLRHHESEHASRRQMPHRLEQERRREIGVAGHDSFGTLADPRGALAARGGRDLELVEERRVSDDEIEGVGARDLRDRSLERVPDDQMRAKLGLDACALGARRRRRQQREQPLAAELDGGRIDVDAEDPLGEHLARRNAARDLARGHRHEEIARAARRVEHTRGRGAPGHRAVEDPPDKRGRRVVAPLLLAARGAAAAAGRLVKIGQMRRHRRQVDLAGDLAGNGAGCGLRAAWHAQNVRQISARRSEMRH